jgi:phosphoglycolate phosphatase
MKFNKYLQSHINKDWAQHYIDYKQLKKYIKKEDNDQFRKLLDSGIKNVNTFVLLIAFSKKTLKTQIDAFIVLNFISVFKIVKKYNKNNIVPFIDFDNLVKDQYFYHLYTQRSRSSSLPVKLIIFDKDGTLVSNKAHFDDWFRDLVSKYIDLIPKRFDTISCTAENLWVALGYNVELSTFEKDSIAITGNLKDMKNRICYFIYSQEYSRNFFDICEFVETNWTDYTGDVSSATEIVNLRELFETLKKQNYLLAVCSNDTAASVEQTLKAYKLTKYVSYSCSSDTTGSLKPSFEPIFHICTELNVPPSQTVLVGDTSSDILSGINARCGKVIGVKSGYSQKTSIFKMADKVLEDVGELPSYLESLG